MKEDDYRVITRDYALSAAKAFSSLADHEFRFGEFMLSGLSRQRNQRKSI